MSPPCKNILKCAPKFESRHRPISGKRQPEIGLRSQANYFFNFYKYFQSKKIPHHMRINFDLRHVSLLACYTRRTK